MQGSPDGVNMWERAGAIAVIVCDKRGAFAHSEAKQSIHPRAETWIASLRSQ
jgi:hypothetical protein